MGQEEEHEPVFIRSTWGTNRYVYNPNNPVGFFGASRGISGTHLAGDRWEGTSLVMRPTSLPGWFRDAASRGVPAEDLSMAHAALGNTTCPVT
ncbi:hypothetical protein [Streptomyces sp. NBC_00829]|uniref:hypothetical protein n=1 Tax=Streptomyces sp. NBC_00829 TaxID=2903679 RepID=UPI00386D38C7|nr:hypothetical protein OG293_20720 [Streptomyces sp. NBC_00829]